jgi:tetrahydromethanopterin S-methyltransferase subunit G
MEKLPTTVEGLAAMINTSLASKEYMKELRTEMDQKFESVDAQFQGINVRLDHLDARVGRIEADVHALRDEMVHRQEFHDALDRIKYIEKKLGIESGV